MPLTYIRHLRRPGRDAGTCRPCAIHGRFKRLALRLAAVKAAMRTDVAPSPRTLAVDEGSPSTLDTPIGTRAPEISVTAHDQEDRAGLPSRIEPTTVGVRPRLPRILHARPAFANAKDPFHLTSVIAMP
jgi:hypothetical protein